MTRPTVACVMLANGRQEMVNRAVRCFNGQTYDNRYLLTWENRGEKSIGELRNMANTAAGCGVNEADIICHWDSDDWSHPNRIAEQVALLQSSGAECVGYNEMLFWVGADQAHFVGCTPAGVSCACGERYARSGGWCPKCHAAPPDAEAWLYRAAVPNYAIGTSMCYWRSAWDKYPFPDRSEGCDDLDWFNRRVKIASDSSVGFIEVRMIASIHGGNTCAKIDPKAREWQRVPEWDAYCRNAMQL